MTSLNKIKNRLRELEDENHRLQDKVKRLRQAFRHVDKAYYGTMIDLVNRNEDGLINVNTTDYVMVRQEIKSAVALYKTAGEEEDGVIVYKMNP